MYVVFGRRSLAGFGLTMRAIEARRGQIWLYDYQGLYQHTPALAICFMLLDWRALVFQERLVSLGPKCWWMVRSKPIRMWVSLSF